MEKVAEAELLGPIVTPLDQHVFQGLALLTGELLLLHAATTADRNHPPERKSQEREGKRRGQGARQK